MSLSTIRRMAYATGYQLGKNKDYFYLVDKRGNVIAQGSIFEIAATVKQHYKDNYNPLYAA
ncbi:MAG TPA: hypothetical protein PK733_16510 [Clostridiales bacterium]|nr:hypothetical protein [Clostridiales bacterium]